MEKLVSLLRHPVPIWGGFFFERINELENLNIGLYLFDIMNCCRLNNSLLKTNYIFRYFYILYSIYIKNLVGLSQHYFSIGPCVRVFWCQTFVQLFAQNANLLLFVYLFIWPICGNDCQEFDIYFWSRGDFIWIKL